MKLVSLKKFLPSGRSVFNLSTLLAALLAIYLVLVGPDNPIEKVGAITGVGPLYIGDEPRHDISFLEGSWCLGSSGKPYSRNEIKIYFRQGEDMYLASAFYSSDATRVSRMNKEPRLVTFWIEGPYLMETTRGYYTSRITHTPENDYVHYYTKGFGGRGYTRCRLNDTKNLIPSSIREYRRDVSGFNQRNLKEFCDGSPASQRCANG